MHGYIFKNRALFLIFPPVPAHFLVVRRTNLRILKTMKQLIVTAALQWLHRIMPVLVVAGMCSLSPAPAAQAAEPLNANEIRQILGGNTVMWNLGKVTQRQYFDARGYTVFEDETFNIDKGLWTVTSDGLFCSNWKQTGWTCYRLALDGASLVWTGPISPFGGAQGEQVVSRLLRGNQTTFSAPQGERGDALVSTVARELEPPLIR